MKKILDAISTSKFGPHPVVEQFSVAVDQDYDDATVVHIKTTQFSEVALEEGLANHVDEKILPAQLILIIAEKLRSEEIRGDLFIGDVKGLAEMNKRIHFFEDKNDDELSS